MAGKQLEHANQAIQQPTASLINYKIINQIW